MAILETEVQGLHDLSLPDAQETLSRGVTIVDLPNGEARGSRLGFDVFSADAQMGVRIYLNNVLYDIRGPSADGENDKALSLEGNFWVCEGKEKRVPIYIPKTNFEFHFRVPQLISSIREFAIQVGGMLELGWDLEVLVDRLNDISLGYAKAGVLKVTAEQ